MKALLRKDFYTLWKQIRTMVLLALVFSLLPGMESFGYAYIMVLAMTLPMNTIAMDEKSRWDKYAAMLPYRPREIVLSKYVFSYIFMAAAVCMTFLLRLFHSFYERTPMDWGEGLADTLGLMALIALVNAISVPALYRFSAEKGRLVMMFLMLGAAAVILDGSQLWGTERMLGWLARIHLPALLIVAAVVIVAANLASIALAERFYIRRREGAYD